MESHPVYRADSGLSEWARELLQRRVYAVLATVNPDGSTHTVPVGFAFEDNSFLIQTGANTRKVRNIERDPRVRVLVQAPPDTMGVDGWVAADGRAHLVFSEEAQRLGELANGRWLTEAGKAAYAHTLGPLLDATIVVVPLRWQTWTVETMAAPFLEMGYTEEEIAGWFLPGEH